MPLRSPIDAVHRALGAKMGAFAGWEMPISYPAGTLAEHAAVRERVGLFDVSHLGKIRVRGAATELLEHVITNRMADLAPGGARYGLVCAEDGGTIDDLIAYALGSDDVLVVPNASNRDAVAEVLRAHAGDGVTIEVVDATTFAVQGPASRRLVEARFPATKGMPYMGVVTDGAITIARSGYTGEWGYEIFTSEADAVPTWDELRAAVADAGGEVCGLASRDTLRLEMGYPLHGNDLSREITPLEAGLGFAVKIDGRSFPGSEALRAPPRRALVGLRADGRVIPRHGCRVRRDGVDVGEVTSGTLSPTLRAPIALALVNVEAADASTLDVDVRDKVGSFDVVDPPFVDASPRREPS
jgi:aminomethyltransferase